MAGAPDTGAEHLLDARSATQRRRPADVLSRLPIRWRLAGGSALLTLVILVGFAIIVGELTTRRIQSDFDQQVMRAADDLPAELQVTGRVRAGYVIPKVDEGRLHDLAAPNDAYIRVLLRDGEVIGASDEDIPDFGSPPRSASRVMNGMRVESRPIQFRTQDGRVINEGYVQYARPLSQVQATKSLVRVLLAGGVAFGSGLALLAGLAIARRAMAPIAALNAAARTIAETRDSTVRLPAPGSEDEIAELTRTLDDMLGSLDAARSETEGALARQREFVADASHELRTPLTAVLANLELLEDVLEGEAKEAAGSALRSSRRMRRLVQDLLMLARADTGRVLRREPVDLGSVVADAAGELESLQVSGKRLMLTVEPEVRVLGVRDELHRVALNLMENALRHTDEGTEVQAEVRRHGDRVTLSVEDDGPGVPEEIRDRVFERFVRGSADRGGSTGLGLAIVRSVARTHGGDVELVAPLDGRGARFVVDLPALAPEPAKESGPLFSGARAIGRAE